MSILKRAAILFFIFTVSLVFSGCWDYKEINQLEIVSGFAVDKDTNTGKYIITVEFVKPTEGGTSNISEILTAEGNTILEAGRNIILKRGTRPYWNHAKIIIVGKEIAEESIIPLLDLVYRSNQVRTDIYLLVSKDKTAGEILYKGAENQKINNGTIISFDIDEGFENGKGIGKYPLNYLFTFIDNLSREGISGTLPLVFNRPNGYNTDTIVEGTAVFKEDKMIGCLDGDETQTYLYTQGTEIYPPIVLYENENINGDEDKPNARISLEVKRYKKKIKPIYKNGKITIQININIDTSISEISNSKIDYMSKEGIRILEEDAKNKIKKDINNLIYKVQKEYKSDIFGFGAAIKRNNPKLWKQIKNDWNEKFIGLDTEIDVDLKIRTSGLHSKPLGIGD